MLFIALMFITTTCVAGAAAFFSVYGLAHTFAASFWSVVFMGGALEAGKLMLASYLYRFKDTVTLKAKALGYIFVFVLMMITSLGIYGYLADAYQSGTTDMKQIDASLSLKKEEQANLQKRKQEIDDQIAAVPVANTVGKQRIMRQFGPEQIQVNERLTKLSAEIQQEVQKQITADSHVGPIVFVAKIFGIAPDNAMSLLILAIVFVFDPVAIYLTIATNTALAKYKEQKESDKLVPKVVEETVALPTPTPEQVLTPLPDPIEAPVVLPDHTEWQLEPIVMDLVTTNSALHPELTSDVETSPGSSLKAPGASFIMTDDTPYYPPPRQPADPERMKVLGELFSKEQTEDVAAEEGTDTPPEQQLAKIYEEVAAKDVTEQTPVDIETMKQIEQFFRRQNLIKNVRSGQ